MTWILSQLLYFSSSMIPVILEKEKTVHVEWLSQLKATVTIKAPRGTIPPKASEYLPMDPEVYAAKLTSFESNDRSDILLQGLRVVSP